MNKVGFVGLGAMGYPIAEHIAKEGYELYFYARRDEVIKKARGFGGVFVPSIEEIGIWSDTVIILVNTYSQCVECFSKLLTNKKKGTVVLSSTVSPKEASTLGEMCMQKGVSLVDAPLSGGVKGAVEGNLTLMPSGNRLLIESLTPLFKTFTKKIVYAGDKVGMGQTLKALNQLLVGVHMTAVAETFTLGKKAGLDLQTIYEAITSSAGTSRILETRGKTLIDRDFSRRSSLNIQKKDLAVCEDLALENGAPFFLGSLCKQFFELSANKFDPEEDISAIIKLYEEMS